MYCRSRAKCEKQTGTRLATTESEAEWRTTVLRHNLTCAAIAVRAFTNWLPASTRRFITKPTRLGLSGEASSGTRANEATPGGGAFHLPFSRGRGVEKKYMAGGWGYSGWGGGMLLVEEGRLGSDVHGVLGEVAVTWWSLGWPFLPVLLCYASIGACYQAIIVGLTIMVIKYDWIRMLIRWL